MKILLCFGTRPEAIKMAPLFHELRKQMFDVKVCVTAQHREMLDQVLDFFDITPDYDLDLMQPNQTLNSLSAAILIKIDEVLFKEKPDLVLVHGDTTTSVIVSLAAFHLGIKIGHIEAGLRTNNKFSPFPEELNRQMVSRIADVHFTPTLLATQNLLQEGIARNAIVEVGNTVIDALFWALNKIDDESYIQRDITIIRDNIPLNKKMILVTGHRRESFGEGFENLCDALLTTAERDDVIIVYPVHLNPKVKQVVYEKLSNRDNIYLIHPVSYPAFVWLMRQSALIVTDSGGIQEEAPSLGKKVLITREHSERPEGIEAGFSILVGTNKEKIVTTINTTLDNFEELNNVNNPYGNGDSAQKIVSYLLRTFTVQLS